MVSHPTLPYKVQASLFWVPPPQMTVTLPYTVVDAFTPLPFKGNPAAVIVLWSPLPEETLQTIATEFNLSETAYITPIDVSAGKFGIRWFTPANEASLCGHATLASAHVLFSGVVPEHVKFIEFQSRVSGILTAKLLEDKRIELEFPAGVPTPVSTEREEVIRNAVTKAFSNVADFEVKAVASGTGVPYGHYLIVEINETFDLESAVITDFGALVGSPISL